ncbi:paxillin-related [Schistosoma mansoni]|uniref:paxillin-related n=1 Tax=Schistosoma mansoni TaxID=6183 RepID=UPI0001A63EC2|nr:paxillin-related [Schistosoma mansoni]|eukprot:XP_018645210.1 paxillin-related [Schistosoma mansoni]
MLNDLSSELSQHGAKTNPRGQCYACKKPINGTLITAIGKEWHPEHFTCASCRVGLVRQDFYERDNQAYCTQCHLKMFSPRCGYCGEAVVEYSVITPDHLRLIEYFKMFMCTENFDNYSIKREVHIA